jgi:hypothetical protein
VLSVFLTFSDTVSGYLFLHFLPALAGCAMIVAGAIQKFGIIMLTGYSRSIVLNGQNEDAFDDPPALIRCVQGFLSKE